MHTSHAGWLLKVTFYWTNPLLRLVLFLSYRLAFPLMAPFGVKLHLLSTKSSLGSVSINDLTKETESGPKLRKTQPKVSLIVILTVFPVVALVML